MTNPQIEAMPADRAMISRLIVARLEATLTSTPHPTDSKAYRLFCEELVDSLAACGFTESELEGGWGRLRDNWTKRSWPVIAEIRGFIFDERTEQRDDVQRLERANRPAIEPPTAREPLTEAQAQAVTDKVARAKETFGWHLNPALTEEEFNDYYLHGIKADRIKAYLSGDAPDGAAVETDPALEGRRLAARVPPAADAPVPVINAHFNQRRPALKEALPPHIWLTLEPLWAEYDDAEALLVSVPNEFQRDQLAAFQEIIERTLDRTVYWAKQIKGRGFTRKQRLEYYEDEVRKQMASVGADDG